MILYQMSQFEMETPMAFSIVVHSNIGQLEALLASILRPQNSYCLYVDKKASVKFQNGVKKLVENYQSAFEQVLNEISCCGIC